MATLYPFRALRPRPADAACIASVPYDVVGIDEARSLAAGNPLSFLRVSRAEIELPAETDPYSSEVYERAAANFSKLRNSSLVLESEPSVYCYQLRMGSHEQLGIAACFSIDEYESGVIKRHERTRRDKEDDRTRHMMALGAQTGPVFLVYRALSAVDEVVARVTSPPALFDFDAPDGVRHTLWRAEREDADTLVRIFCRIPAAYIADGHHRAASAARARDELRRNGATRPSTGDGADFNTLLAVAFPDNQVQILPYNRVVRDLDGLEADEFIRRVSERFGVERGPATPTRRGEIAMYFQAAWWTLRALVPPDPTNLVESLDVSVLQNNLLAPVLGVEDVRVNRRIDFVGGARGTRTLQQLVDGGAAAVAFSMFPLSVTDLMDVSDAGAILPPKSTWFEPKLRDGLLNHLI